MVGPLLVGVFLVEVSRGVGAILIFKIGAGQPVLNTTVTLLLHFGAAQHRVTLLNESDKD